MPFTTASDPLTGTIIGAAIDVHRALGPGLYESVYKACLVHLLEKRGLRTETKFPIQVHFDGIFLECGYRADLVVEGQVLVELKAIEALSPVHEAQILTYLRLSQIRRGLLMNFNVLRLVDGVRRYILDPPTDGPFTQRITEDHRGPQNRAEPGEEGK